MFSDTIREAIRLKGLWLIMQDSDGDTAADKGDIVVLARIIAVDWLSNVQIRVDIELAQWGMIDNEPKEGTGRYLKASLFPLWKGNQKLSENDLLVVRLKQWLLESNHQPPQNISELVSISDPGWLCWRWLEVLPLPIDIKQRLLKHPTPRPCLRYLKRLIRQSDLYAGLLR